MADADIVPVGMASMANTDPIAPFRFMDLPGELRNKVYALSFCSFRPYPGHAREFSDGFLSNSFLSNGSDTLRVVGLPHTNDLTILLANSQIHREAYNIMVKTNRFIRICSTQGLPLQRIFCRLGVAVVATGHRAAQFSGYVEISWLKLQTIARISPTNRPNVDIW